MSLLGEEGVQSSGSAGANTGGSTTTNSGQTSSSGSAAGWRDLLPEDIRNHPTLQTFSDVSNLAKSFIHAQEKIGKKGVMVPGEKASDEEWDTFYNSIGRPELGKYEVSGPKDKNLDPELMKGFKEASHKAGILPKQAEKLLNWWEQTRAAGDKANQDLRASETQKGIDELRREWGDGFDKNVKLAQLAVRELGGSQFQEHLMKSNLANDPYLTRILAKAGKLLGEDKLRGEANGAVGQTPAEINAQIQELMANPAYYDRTHGQHKVMVDKVAELHKRLWPEGA